jgi:hypothetical protein
MSKAWFIVRYRPPEGGERSRQYFNAFQISANVVDNTIQFTSHSFYGDDGFHNRFPPLNLGVSFAIACRVKTLGARWFLISRTSSILD